MRWRLPNSCDLIGIIMQLSASLMIVTCSPESDNQAVSQTYIIFTANMLECVHVNILFSADKSFTDDSYLMEKYMYKHCVLLSSSQNNKASEQTENNYGWSFLLLMCNIVALPNVTDIHMYVIWHSTTIAKNMHVYLMRYIEEDEKD